MLYLGRADGKTGMMAIIEYVSNLHSPINLFLVFHPQERGFQGLEGDSAFIQPPSQLQDKGIYCWNRVVSTCLLPGPNTPSLLLPFPSNPRHDLPQRYMKCRRDRLV